MAAVTPDPTLFDLEREHTYTPHGTPFVPYTDRLCGGCRRPLGGLPHAHQYGHADQHGSYNLCDPCAALDPQRTGVTPWILAVEAVRRRVYAAGGGETAVHAQLVAEGLVTP